MVEECLEAKIKIIKTLINSFYHILKEQLSIHKIYVIIVINFAKHAAKEMIKMLPILHLRIYFNRKLI